MTLVGTVWDLHDTVVLALKDIDDCGNMLCLTLDDEKGTFDVGTTSPWHWSWFQGIFARRRIA